MSCSAKPRSTHLEFPGLLRDEIKSTGSFGRNTRYFHEKAARVKPFFLGRAYRTVDCRRTGGTVSFQSFLHRKVFRPAIDTADRRPAGGAQCCHPKFSNHRLALLPSALFVELLLRCQTDRERPSLATTSSGAGCPQSTRMTLRVGRYLVLSVCLRRSAIASLQVREGLRANKYTRRLGYSMPT
jgi:hypothetical protein